MADATILAAEGDAMTPPVGILAKHFAPTWPDGAEGVTTQPTVPAPIAAALDMVVAWWQSVQQPLGTPTVTPTQAIAALRAQVGHHFNGIDPADLRDGSLAERLEDAQRLLRHHGYTVYRVRDHEALSVNGTVTLPQDQTCLTSEQVEAVMQTPDDAPDYRFIPCGVRPCQHLGGMHAAAGCTVPGCVPHQYQPWQGAEMQA